MTFKQRIDDYQRHLILEALAECGGNQRRAAARLGILPTTLCEKLKRLGLRPSSVPAPLTVEATAVEARE